MSSTSRPELQERLSELAKRIDSRAREFKEQGGFSIIRRETIDQINRRYDELQKRVESAASNGSVWELIRAQLVRDYSRLFDDFLRFEEHLDAEEMKGVKPSGWWRLPRPVKGGELAVRQHPGNRYAFKHGRYTAEVIASRREVAAIIRAMKKLTGAVETRKSTAIVSLQAANSCPISAR
jgi:hypothetical protein